MSVPSLVPSMKPKRRLTIVQDVLLNLDRITRELGDAASKLAYRQGATCSASCGSGCCYQLFSIRFPEGLQLAKWLVDQNLVNDELMERLNAAKARTVSETDCTNIGGTYKTPREYFTERNPCVFLTPDQRCSVYDGRPLTCRLYFVTSDPKLCHPDTGDPSHHQVTYLDREPFHRDRDRAWPVAEAELGLPPNVWGLEGPLPLMVLLGLTYLAGGPDAVIPLLKPASVMALA
jgi:Fe-S-cluster containining protein